MRIGLFTDTYFPQINGVATSVRMHKENLEKLGHQVFVFTTSDPHAAPEARVFRIASIPFVNAKRISFMFYPGLFKLVRALELDLIHTHTEFSLGIFGRSMARQLRIPLVHTYHTIYEHYTHYITRFGVLDPVAKKLARKISVDFCNSADQLIVPSAKVKDLLHSYRIKRPVTVIPTGINLEKFNKNNYCMYKTAALRASLGIEPDQKVLLYIGRLSKEKNIDELLLYWKEYHTGNPHVRFLLVGDGPDRKRLQEITEELGIAGHTFFAGAVGWEQIGMYYQLGDVFVNASQSESQGLTFLEAMASGLPVVAKADPCLEGLLSPSINGYTFRNQAEFNQGLSNVLNNTALREQLSAAAVNSTQNLAGGAFAKSLAGLYAGMLVDQQESVAN